MTKNGVIQVQSGVGGAPFDNFDNTAGSPGIGFYLQSGTATATAAMLTDHGLTNVTATNISAASCNYTDVNAVINGPTHTAVAGETISIPGGTCTWTAGQQVTVTQNISIIGAGTPNTLPSQFGAGTTNTIIIDNNTTNAIFLAQISYSAGALYRLSSMDIEPVSTSATLHSPIQIAGTCTTSGCPSIRIDNMNLGITTFYPHGYDCFRRQRMAHPLR